MKYVLLVLFALLMFGCAEYHEETRQIEETHEAELKRVANEAIASTEKYLYSCFDLGQCLGVKSNLAVAAEAHVKDVMVSRECYSGNGYGGNCKETYGYQYSAESYVCRFAGKEIPAKEAASALLACKVSLR